MGANVAYPSWSCWKRSFFCCLARRYRLIAFPVRRRARCLWAFGIFSAASEHDDPGSRRRKLWGSSIFFEEAAIICLFETERENGAAMQTDVPRIGSKFYTVRRRASVSRFFNNFSSSAFFRARGGIIRERLARALIVSGPSHQLRPADKGVYSRRCALDKNEI